MTFKKSVFTCAALLIFLTSCETDDVEGPPVQEGPLVTLALSQPVISENGGTSDVVASLSETSSSTVTVGLSFTGSAEGGGVDYNVDSDVITIAAGNITGAATVTAVDNDEEDGNRSIVVRITDVEGGYSEDNQEQIITIEDDEGPIMTQVIINEVLYDPPGGDAGDANGDGVRDPLEDEFMEFINLSSQELDMSGFKIYDAEALDADEPRHVFPDGSIVPPGKAMVVFGGGMPTGGFGGSVVQTASGGQLNMNNAGDFMTVTDSEGIVLVTFDIEPLSNNPDESYTRNPDITGEFEQHAANTPLLFSPGTRIDGSNF